MTIAMKNTSDGGAPAGNELAQDTSSALGNTVSFLNTLP